MELTNLKFESDYIFPKSNFWTGIASIVDVAGNFYKFKYSKTPDKDAIESDWIKVANDLKTVDSKFASENLDK